MFAWFVKHCYYSTILGSILPLYRLRGLLNIVITQLKLIKKSEVKSLRGLLNIVITQLPKLLT